MATPRTVRELAAAMEQRFNTVDSQIMDIEERLSVVRRNEEVGHLLGQLKADQAKLRQQFEAMGANMVLAGQLDELTTVVNGMVMQITMLEDGQRALAAEQAATRRQVTDLEASQRETDGNVRIIGTSVARAHARIDRLAPEKFNPIAAGITFGVLLFFWVVWYLPTDFGSQVTKNIYVASQLDTVWGAILGLVIALLTAAFVGYVFGRPGQSAPPADTLVHASASASADTRVLPAQPAPAHADAT